VASSIDHAIEADLPLYWRTSFQMETGPRRR